MNLIKKLCVFSLIFASVWSAPEFAKYDKFAESGQLPYNVVIYWLGKLVCNGALVKYKNYGQFVITSGLCVSEDHDHNDKLANVDDLEIRSGIINLEDQSNAQIAYPTHLIRHPKWHRTGLKNDLAVLRIDEDFELDRYTQAINIPDIENWHPGEGRETTAGAFGFISVPDEVDNKIYHRLKYSKVYYLPKKECEKNGYPGLVDEKTAFCVHNKRRNVDEPVEPVQGVCYGDWGGTLAMYHGQVDEFYLYGIFCWAQPGCMQNKDPVKYTKIDAYLDWLVEAAYDGKVPK